MSLVACLKLAVRTTFILALLVLALDGMSQGANAATINYGQSPDQSCHDAPAQFSALQEIGEDKACMAHCARCGVLPNALQLDVGVRQPVHGQVAVTALPDFALATDPPPPK